MDCPSRLRERPVGINLAQRVVGVEGRHESVTAPECSPGQLAALLRFYTTGFVIDEQAYLELKETDEWDSLVQQIADGGHHRPAEADDLIAILRGLSRVRRVAVNNVQSRR